VRRPLAHQVTWLALIAGSLFSCKALAGPCTPVGVIVPDTSDAPVCNVPRNLVYIKVGPTNDTIEVGMTVQMVDTITNNPTNATFAVSWRSSDTTKATVNSTGLVLGKAVSSGVAICATVVDVGFDVESCATLNVEAAPPANVTAEARSRQRIP
jgi:hypothetical protein